MRGNNKDLKGGTFSYLMLEESVPAMLKMEEPVWNHPGYRVERQVSG